MKIDKNRQLDYIVKREEERIKAVIKADEEYRKRLLKLYNTVMDQITKDMESAYTRYSLSEGITIEEANKRVSKMDVQAFSEKAKKYVKEKDFSERANYELKIYNLKMRMSRLDLMKREMLLRTAYLADREEAMVSERLKEEALEELYRQAGILGIKPDIVADKVKRVDKIVNDPYHGSKFSNRIWANQEDLQNKLDVGLTRSLLLGENPREWSITLRDFLAANMIKENTKNALYMADRLARTESARVQIEVIKDMAKEAGYKKLIWIAEPNSDRTCETCLDLHGKIFEISDSRVGVELPPIHPNCRCSVAAYYD